MAYDNLSVNSQQIKKFKIIQDAKIIIVIIIVAAIGVGAWFAYDYYRQAVSELDSSSQNESVSITEPVTGVGRGSQAEVISLDDSQNQPEPVSPSSPDYGNYSTTPNSAPQTTPAPSAPGTSNSIPDGVAQAMNSIQAGGIKGSQYVSPSLDTSQLPDGTTITFNRSSWTSLSPTSGAVSATANIQGQIIPTNITFEQSGGIWKAVGYSLN